MFEIPAQQDNSRKISLRNPSRCSLYYEWDEARKLSSQADFKVLKNIDGGGEAINTGITVKDYNERELDAAIIKRDMEA